MGIGSSSALSGFCSCSKSPHLHPSPDDFIEAKGEFAAQQADEELIERASNHAEDLHQAAPHVDLATNPPHMAVDMLSVAMTAIDKAAVDTTPTNSNTWGELTRQSSNATTNMYDEDPGKDAYIQRIAGESFVADFHGSGVDEHHMQSLASKMSPSTAVLKLNYANCKDVNDQLLWDLASCFSKVACSGAGMPGLRALSVSFRSCSKISDKGLAGLAMSFQSTLQVLELDLRFCSKITSAGLAAVANKLPSGLQRLVFKFRCSDHLDDTGLVALGRSLPSKLESFEFDCCKSSKIGIGGILGLMQSLPSQLRSICLGFECCFRVNDECLAGLAQLLPRKLQVLSINCWQCMQITDGGLAALAQRLPETLNYFSLRTRSCKGVGDPGATAVAQALPPALKSLQVDLSYCLQIGDATVMAFAHGLPQSVQVLDFNCQNTRVSKTDFSFHASPETLRALCSQGEKTTVQAAIPTSPPDPQKYAVSPAAAVLPAAV